MIEIDLEKIKTIDIKFYKIGKTQYEIYYTGTDIYDFDLQLKEGTLVLYMGNIVQLRYDAGTILKSDYLPDTYRVLDPMYDYTTKF